MTTTLTEEILPCRCGGKPTEPRPVPGCADRWIISCQVPRCYARNIGQDKHAVIQGWNRLSSSFYR